MIPTSPETLITTIPDPFFDVKFETTIQSTTTGGPHFPGFSSCLTFAVGNRHPLHWKMPSLCLPQNQNQQQEWSACGGRLARQLHV